MEVCQKCGLPKDLCVCDILEKEQAENIVVFVTKSKFKKVVTVVQGIDKSKLTETAKNLKHGLACGGTVKDENVVLQGDHKAKVKEILISMGYLADHITVENRPRK